MALQTGGDCGSTTSWWTHRRYEEHVFNPIEWLLLRFTIIPSLVVHVLSEKFKRRLCTVLLFFWHVEIVDENSVLLAHGWSVNTLAPLIKFLIKVILSLIGRRLSRECHREWKEFLRHFV
jgi:hypothetical protein